MQDNNRYLPRTTCSTCGKIVPKRDVRDRKAQYCDRKCAAMAKFKNRYRGTASGPFTRPVDMMSKMRWTPTPRDILGSDIPAPGVA